MTRERIVAEEVGDRTAPPGSRPWALAIRDDIQGTLKDMRGDAEHLQTAIGLMRRHEGWKALSDKRGRPFRTFEAFCVAPYPLGLGYCPENIEAIIAQRKAREAKERADNHLTLLDNPGPPTKEEREVNSSNTRNKPLGKQCDADYLTARIARDHPAILDRMKAGEFRSVRAAALEAGIVKPRLSVPADPDDAARYLLEHFQGEALARLIRALTESE